jgi:hypothetical protein
MCEGRDDEACGFNPWFAYLREVKAQAWGRLEAGEDPEEIRRGFLDRIGGGWRGGPAPMLDRLRAVAALALDAVLPASDGHATAYRGRLRPAPVGVVFDRRWDRG